MNGGDSWLPFQSCVEAFQNGEAVEPPGGKQGIIPSLGHSKRLHFSANGERVDDDSGHYHCGERDKPIVLDQVN